MEIFFCDVCCSRVSNSHLNRGQGVLNGDVVICGSCLEKGHGTDLLKQSQSQKMLVGAAPKLAGSGALDGLRDRASTQKNMTADFSPEDDVADVDDLLEAASTASAVAKDNNPIDEDSAADEADDIEIAENVEDDNGLQLANDDLGSESAHFEEDILDNPGTFESPEVAVVDISEIDDDSGLQDIERPESSSISADDVIDDLMDEADDDRSESDVLDDADDEVHTDSYSVDELAAIKRLAENEKKNKESAAAAALEDQPSKKSSGRKKTYSGGSSRRNSSSGRNPATSGRKKSGVSKRNSRRTSAKTKKLGPGGLPMPLFISLITIPLMLLLFVMFKPSGNNRPTSARPDYGPTQDGMSYLIKDTFSLSRKALAEQDIGKINKALGMIMELRGYMDEFTQRMKAEGWSENQVGLYLKRKKLNDLLGGVNRSLRDMKVILEQ
ncbi:MAG: hypothetical protein HRU15_02220 [Planctomycetes bacterium]|nr:hypothetical protein [Planctomycetota bacterium]